MALEIRHFVEGEGPEVLVDGESIALSPEQLALVELLCVWSKREGPLTYGDAALVVKGDRPGAKRRLAETVRATRRKLCDAGADDDLITTGPAHRFELALSRDAESDLRDCVEAAEAGDFAGAAAISKGATVAPLGADWTKTTDRAQHRDRLEALLAQVNEKSARATAGGPGGACASHVAAVLNDKDRETFSLTPLATLIRDPALMMPFRGRNWQAEEPCDDVLQFTIDRLARGRSETVKVLVDGEPGSGKSILSLALLHELCERFHDDPGAWPFPVYVDLRVLPSELRGSEIGGDAWMRSLLERVSADIDWILPGERARKRGVRPIFLVDSAEFPLRGSRIEEGVLEGPLFEHAICFCRSSYFEQHLAWRRHGFTRLQLEKVWEWDLVHDYVEQELKRLSPLRELSTRERLEEWWRHADIRELCRVPLYLAMAVELAVRENKSSRTIEGRLGLFDRYMSVQMKRKQAEVAEKELRELLEKIGWFFDTDVSEKQPIWFSHGQLVDLVTQERAQDSKHDVDTLVFNLECRSVLTSVAADVEDDALVNFVHGIFGAYFAAARVDHVAKREGERERVAAHFAHFFPYEVTAFLVEHFERLVNTQRLRDGVVRTLQGAFESPAGLSAASVRIAREQIGYFLGTCFGSRADAFLRSRLTPDQKEDSWVRRGIAVGLAESGIEGPLDDLVVELRGELELSEPTVQITDGAVEAKRPCPLRDMNIGFNRSFFGDQPLDPNDPARIVLDKEMSCGNTVRGLTTGLAERRRLGSARLALFTICDLGTRASVEHGLQGFDEALKVAPKEFDQVLEELAQQRPHWEEIAEVQELRRKAKGQG